MTVVHPVVCKGLAGCGFALCYFVFMVGEYEVNAACVYVEGLAQYIKAHCGAFYMPAGSALSPR